MDKQERLDKIEKGLEKIDKEIELLIWEATELRKQIKNEKPKEWPQVGDEYWFIDNNGDVTLTTWMDHEVDHARKSIGNIFPTREAAEKEVAVRKAIQYINEWRGYKDEDWVDFKDKDQMKSYVFFKLDTQQLKGRHDMTMRESRLEGHFKTAEERNRCIEECAPQLRTIFGVGG
jgi:hypothetical protein